MLMGKSILNFHKIITNIFPFHKSLIITIVDGNRYTHTQKIYYTFLLCSKQEHITNRQTFICLRTAYSKRYINELCNLKILQKNIFRFMAFPCCWQLGRFFSALYRIIWCTGCCLMLRKAAVSGRRCSMRC